MLSNKEFCNYFYQESNLKGIEQLVVNFSKRIESCNAPESDAETEKYVQLNPVIATKKDVNSILDDLIYPTLQEIVSPDEAKKPKISFWTSKLSSNFGNFLKEWYKYLPFLVGLGTVYQIAMKHPLKDIVDTQAILASFATVAGFLKLSYAVKSAGAYKLPFLNKRVFVRPVEKNFLTHCLAHEVVHAVQGQYFNISQKFKDAFTPSYTMQNEGLAESLAIEVCNRLEDKMNSYRLNSSIAALNRVTSAYFDFCNKLNIDEKNRTFQPPKDTPASAYSFNCYNAGFTAIELLRNERGDAVLENLIKNKPIKL